MILYSAGTLRWYDRLDLQHHRKPYAYGSVVHAVTGPSQIPTFQLCLASAFGTVTVFKIVSKGSGTEYDVLSAAVMAGLELRTQTGFKALIYPETVTLPGTPIPIGHYYAVVSDGTTTLYSEVWGMRTDTDTLTMLEYCHSGQFSLPGGIAYIDYRYGFKMRAYFDEAVGKPQYQYENVVSRRNGFDQPLKQVSWKQHVFVLDLVEETVDWLHRVPQHDAVTIRADRGIVYECDSFEMLEPDWETGGDICHVECVFRTDTVVVVSGRALTGAGCELSPGDCFNVEIECVTRILEGGAEYVSEAYTDAVGDVVNFADGDRILIEDSGTGIVNVHQFDADGTPTHYPLVAIAGGEIAYDLEHDTYYEALADLSGYRTTEITGVTGLVLEGSAMEPAVITVEGRDFLGEVFVLTNAAASELNDDGELGFGYVDVVREVRLLAGNGRCPVFATTDWIELDPFEVLLDLDIEQYQDAAAAEADGAEPGDYFVLTLGNSYGYPVGTLVRLPPREVGGVFTTYAAGAARVGTDWFFAMSGNNGYGHPEGVVSMVVDTVPTYATPALASAGGVAANAFYAYDGTSLGIDGVLIRKLVMGPAE